MWKIIILDNEYSIIKNDCNPVFTLWTWYVTWDISRVKNGENWIIHWYLCTFWISRNPWSLNYSVTCAIRAKNLFMKREYELNEDSFIPIEFIWKLIKELDL